MPSVELYKIDIETQEPYTLVLEKESHLVWSSPSRQGWSASEDQESASLCLPSVGITGANHHAQILLSLFFTYILCFVGLFLNI